MGKSKGHPSDGEIHRRGAGGRTDNRWREERQASDGERRDRRVMEGRGETGDRAVTGK
jgi:hypothetical protein